MTTHRRMLGFDVGRAAKIAVERHAGDGPGHGVVAGEAPVDRLRLVGAEVDACSSGG